MNDKNQSSARNYSIIALILALLACIATFFLGITRGLVLRLCAKNRRKSRRSVISSSRLAPSCTRAK